MKKYTKEFDLALKGVIQERGAIYGHPLDNFQRVAMMKMVVKDCSDPIVRHVLEMICVKVCRLVETPDHLDSLIDIAGYTRTVCMAIDKRNEDLNSEISL